MTNRTSDIMWNQLFQLNARSTLSLQEQIREQMVAAILERHLPLGAPVPSGRELAVHLDVARNTVVLAYQQLVEEGYLIPRKRSGFFVNPDMVTGRRPAPVELPQDQTTTSDQPDWPSRLRFKPNAQRNIAKVSNWQRYKYPFIYGQFDPSLFPTNEWRECCQKVLGVMEIRDWAPDLFTRDDQSLIEQVRSKVLPLRGVWAAPDEIIVTNGAQNALFMLAHLLMDHDTTVGVENPGYPDARNIFASRTTALRPLKIDAHGLAVGKQLRGLDYIYATPSHQSPTTATMPMERRVALLQQAEREDFVIIEDDYETETSFSGLPNPALKSLDRSNRVLYIGSLSKTLAPGLRLGYIVAPAALIAELRGLRRLMIRHPTAFIQRSFALFLSLGHYDALTRRLMAAHRDRAARLQTALAQCMPDVSYVPINGGSSFWLSGPAWLDARKLTAMAQEHDILIEPGDVYFMADKPPLHHFRLGFSSIRLDRIEPGIQLLGKIVSDLKTQSA